MKILIKYIFSCHKIPTWSKNQSAQEILTYCKMFSLDVHNNPVRLKSQGWLLKLYRWRNCSESLVLTLSHLARLAFIQQISVKHSLGLDGALDSDVANTMPILTHLGEGKNLNSWGWDINKASRLLVFPNPRKAWWYLDTVEAELSNKLKSRGFDQSLCKKP